MVARLDGAEVDTDRLRELTMDLKARLDQGGRTFVLCFREVDFLPSACLALLLMFHQDTKPFQARIILLNCQENVALLLQLARLDALFELAHGDPFQV